MIVKETLNHLSKVLSVSGAVTRLEILAAVLIPSLESRLRKFLSDESVTPNEIDLLLVQKIISNIKQLIKSKEALNYCHTQKVFPLVISARHVEWLSDDVYRFAFHFVEQELRQIMNSATSLESLTVWSGIEVSTDENESQDFVKDHETSRVTHGDGQMCHAKAVYRAFTANATLSDMLTLLENRSEEFVTETNLTPFCLSETLALWQLQVT